MRSLGIGRGDEVILQVDQASDYLAAFWACLLGGFIAVPLACGSKDEQLAKVHQVCKRLKTPWFISTTWQADRLGAFWDVHNEDRGWLQSHTLLLDVSTEETPSAEPATVDIQPKPEDVAFIQFSSGSTGNPKGVMLTHAEVLANCHAFIERAGVTRDDVPLGWMPLTHDMGLIGTHLGSIVAGLTPVLMPTALFVRRPLLWLQKVHEHRATVLSSPNFGLQYTISALRAAGGRDAEWDLSTVRMIWNGAEPISHETCTEFEAKLAQFGLPPRVIYPCYGLAEATVAATLQDPGEPVYVHRLRRDSLAVGQKVRPATSAEPAVSFSECGYALPCCQVQIGDPAGRPLPAQHVGHVLIRGSSVTQGYYRDAEATAAASRPADWLDTGDLGFLTKTGRLVITGRTKDVIILNGANLYPHDIERLIEGVAGVTTGQVAVCGVKFRHASLVRTALAAFVVFRQGAEPFVPIASAIRTQVMTAAGIQVDYVVPVMRLPRTTSGKIQRFELAAAFEDNLFDAPSKTAGIRRRLTIPQAVPTAGIAP